MKVDDFKYYVFGSPSSKDLDLIVFVDAIPEMHLAKQMCKDYQVALQPFFAKEVNANIGLIGEDVLLSVFKGTLDEVNNSIIDTYSFHEQKHPLTIKKRLDRDVEQKILHSVRIVLSTLSRSQHRELVKTSLKGDLNERINALDIIDLSIPLDKIKYEIKDIYKTLAFQMGQTLALIDGTELYTKEGIAEYALSLKPFLYREDELALTDLDLFKKVYLAKVRKYIPKMTKLVE